MPDEKKLIPENELPESLVPIETSPITPGLAPAGAPAPPAPHDMPQFFQGSMPPQLQHDTAFVGTEVGTPRIPKTALMPFGPQNNPSLQAAITGEIKIAASAASKLVPFNDITSGDNTGALLNVADLSELTYEGTGIVNANEIGGIGVAVNVPTHTGQLLISQPGNTAAAWADPQVQGLYAAGSSIASPPPFIAPTTIQPVLIGGADPSGKLQNVKLNADNSISVALAQNTLLQLLDVLQQLLIEQKRTNLILMSFVPDTVRVPDDFERVDN
jgi:hypothetical protein